MGLYYVDVQNDQLDIVINGRNSTQKLGFKKILEIL